MSGRASSRNLLTLAVTALALGGLTACTSDDSNDQQAPSAFLEVEISPRRLAADGTTADITLLATEADGTLGEGTVTVRATTGQIDGAAEATVTLANGRATATYSCDAAEDSKCLGTQRVTAEWKGAVGSEMLELFLGDTQQDAGVPDAGEADAGEADAGEADAGEEPDAGPATMGLTLEASKNRVFFQVGDYAELTATLVDEAGAPAAGQSIDFTATRGGLTAADGAGTPAATLSVTTDEDGLAKARLYETGEVGTAEITARHTPSNARARVTLEIVRVRQISWDSTSCGGEECTIMGVKGSGFNEQAQVSFKVVDALGEPVEGVAVTFSAVNPPLGTTVSPDGLTDATGLVTANVSAGSVIGVFTVKAVVLPNEVEASSPSIGVRGAKASNHGFSLRCTPVNNGALVTQHPGVPRPFQIPCEVKIVDRYNNPVGTMATPVQFKVEAGSIPNAVTTTPYSPGGNNSEEGSAAIVFDTIGGTPWPWDVEPLAASPNQWPYARDLEPSVESGYLLKNPRDGLVTVLAYVRGEEYFADNNANGTYDVGEQFIDQGEPFVDANDNGTRDTGELYIDEAPRNGEWDEPNGQRDADTTIWTETRILYTGRPVPEYAYVEAGVPPVTIEDFGFMPKYSAMVVYAYFPDENFNRPQAEGTGFDAEHFATLGSVEWPYPSLLDGYGFGLDRILVNAVGEAACTPTTAICQWKMVFTNWGRGYCGWAEIKGDQAANPDPPEMDNQNDVVKLTATVLEASISQFISGIMD